MQKLWLLLSALVALSVLWPLCAFAGHDEKPVIKKAILLVAFGTSVPEAQEAFDLIEAQTRQAFPDMELRWAYTSRIIRAKLAKQGKQLDSPETALARLMDQSYTHVAVLSLHTIPGLEFHDLQRSARAFSEMSGGLRRVLVAQPLLSSHDDMVRVARVLVKHLPAERKPEDAVLFMGHGSEKHPADAMYSAMNWVLQDLSSNVFMGTVAGHPSLEELLPKLLQRKVKRAFLLPFMAVAGDHARNDMAGDGPESWKSILAQNGIASIPVMKGTAEYPEIVAVWLDHLRDVIAQL